MTQLSFRDPDGFVFRSGARILRCVFPHAVGDVCAFLSSAVAHTGVAEGILPFTRVLDGASTLQLASEPSHQLPDGSIVLEHEPIPFTNYPYEWAPEMLHSAAALTLRLAREAGGAGFGLKDATPYNIMFEGSKPVFIDVLSFERREELDGLWRPYAQFVRTFIYPLLAQRHFGLHLDELLLVHREGLEPDRILRLSSAWRLLLPPFLGSVTIPALLWRDDRDLAQNRFRVRRAKDPGEAKFVLNSLFARANRLLRRMASQSRKSTVSRYAGSELSYTSPQFAEKEGFVMHELRRWRSKNILDIGCNTGYFSLLAARQGARVISIDKDPDAIGELWRTASGNNLDILPLVIDIARPPGACGWANHEFPSFLDRARGASDCVLMLAVLHHLFVNERIPLDHIFDLAAELTTCLAIVEYVDPADAQFQRIARGRDALHRHLTTASFEAAARRHFALVASCEITSTRRVYTLQKGRA